MKPIGIGVSDFREIIKTGSFYVDKTKFIEELVEDGAKVQLITRPRRFGKTLNMSMLKYFFDIEKGKENRKLFDGLYIEKSDAMSEQGKYPVISISFKDIKSDSAENMMSDLINLIKELYNEFSFLRESLNESELIEFDKIWLGKREGNYNNSLKNLCRYLKEYYNQEVILLIDEYDTPMVSAYEWGYYDKIISFFTALYGSSLKDNIYLQKAVLTGIMRVAKENIFSGLNNINTNSILEKNFADCFGLTEKEVENSLKMYGLEEKSPEVQRWYNGYNFGGVRVYNPFSITNFLKKEELMPYWVNTSNNALISKVLKEADDSIFEELTKLFKRETIEKTINIYSNFRDLKNTEQIWYLLTNAGYLTPVEKITYDKYSIKIPNEEVHSFFEKDFIRNFLGGVDKFDKILKYLVTGNLEDFTYELEDIFLRNASCFDFSADANEGYYHVFILGLLLALRRDYYIRSNRESGRGRYDLALEPKDKNKMGLIIELKAPRNTINLEDESQKALLQIEENRYDVDLKERGIKDILLLGMAFHKRDFKISWKRV